MSVPPRSRQKATGRQAGPRRSGGVRPPPTAARVVTPPPTLRVSLIPCLSISEVPVTIIAAATDTLDGLHRYLSESGVASTVRTTLCSARGLPAQTAAVVLFPDDFEVGESVRCASSLRAALPALLILLVTSNPQRFGLALEPDGRSVTPVTLARPAFAWTILDTIRSHAEQDAP